ncbi:aminoglycoside phosphotransferase family protein [Actinoallomurus acaciae]|uniref:Aminoglycoside phosphotransferase family protein n=1 Tax=Actinoallomurus acaciae TaxID=502577 RepID=A0ABV5YG75_9ACTN
MVRGALGAGFRVIGVDRPRGGSKKGVYRVRLDRSDPPSVIVYRWADEENFWPESVDDDGTGPFAPASGLAPFLAARRRLDEVGARVPRLLWADGVRERYAVVEDTPGGTLETLFATDPGRTDAALADLARTLGLMQRHRAPRYGRVDVLERGGTAAGSSCEQLVLDRARRDLEEAAGRDTRIKAMRGRLDERLRELRALVAPRTEYGLIHGELGPDHVLVSAEGHAVLIDIEGLMYFDVGWEVHGRDRRAQPAGGARPASVGPGLTDGARSCPGCGAAPGRGRRPGPRPAGTWRRSGSPAGRH